MPMNQREVVIQEVEIDIAVYIPQVAATINRG